VFKNTVFRVKSLTNLSGDTTMPIFEYKCNKCGRRMEFLEKRKNRAKHACKDCGSSDMQKLFSGFSVGQSSQGSDSCSTGTCPTGTCGL
jgi:putative FmdB family regulatory protein